MRIRVWGLRRNKHGIRAEGTHLNINPDYFCVSRCFQMINGGYCTYYPIHIRWKRIHGRRWFRLHRKPGRDGTL